MAGTDKRAMPSVQFFLLFLYHRDVLFANLNDATLSSLGNPHNMQIKAAIAEILLSSVFQSLCMVSKTFCFLSVCFQW